MSYCKLHGQYEDPYKDGCPECIKNAEAEAEHQQEILNSLNRLREEQENSSEETAYAINNPGEFICPHCRLRSLLEGASRCPRCQGTIDYGYMHDVIAKRNEIRRVEAIKQLRLQKQMDEDRKEQLRLQKQKDEDRKQYEEKKRRWSVFSTYQRWVVPSLSLISAHFVTTAGQLEGYLCIVYCIPVFNWLAALVNLVNGYDSGSVEPRYYDDIAKAHYRAILLKAFVIWAVLGLLILIKDRKPKI